jgi:hypothetical protein
MKYAEKVVFEAVLIVTLVCAPALFPRVVEAQAEPQAQPQAEPQAQPQAQPPALYQPPSFAAFDRDSDGSVSEEEFDAFVAERRAARAAAGRPMKGLGIAPAFGDIDSDGDGKLTEAEFTAGQQAHRKAMREAHSGKGHGPGHGMHKGMKMPTFEDLDLDGNGCISAEEFAKHQAEMHNR